MAVNDVMNNQILGAGYSKWQFSVPIKISKTEGVEHIIGKISIKNTKVSELINNLDKILTLCLPPEEVDRLKNGVLLSIIIAQLW